MSNLIYVIDDDKNIREIIKKYLVKDGYNVVSFDNAIEALDYTYKDLPNLIILDIMMPEMNGYDFCREFRKRSEIPIIFVSAKDEEIDRILGLELGADDYLSKPFSPRELVVRVKTILRRVKKTLHVSDSKKVLSLRDIKIYEKERKITSNNVELKLTTKEYDLLTFLIENKNSAFNREQLFKNIWKDEYFEDSRSIDDLVKRVRKKLSAANSLVEIKTIWGYGYKVEE